MHEYYKLAVTLVQGDTYALHQLVARLPDVNKRTEFAAHHLKLIRRCRAPGQQHLPLNLPAPAPSTPCMPVPASTPWLAATASATAAHINTLLENTPSSPMPTQRGQPLQHNNNNNNAPPIDPHASSPVVVWLRKDLRLTDNHALHAAAASGRPVVLLYAWAPQEFGPWLAGGATKYWLHHALACFARTLRARYGATLLLYDASKSSSLAVLLEVVVATQAREVVWNRAYEPWAVLRDNAVDHALTHGEDVDSSCVGCLVYAWYNMWWCAQAARCLCALGL